MATIREDWLQLTLENAIDPDLLICDPHHHLWYQEENPYTADDLQQDIEGGHKIIKTVFVESCKMLRKDGPTEMKPVGETEFVRDIAEKWDSKKIKVAQGIVGFADLTLGNSISPVLEAHEEAGKGRFKGIRYSATWDASPEIRSSAVKGIYGNSKFRQGFACLKKFGLSFDAWVYHTQLCELYDLAKTYDEIPIILDHIGGPLGIGPYAHKREEVFREWKKEISELSVCENVFLKLGGLGMELCGFRWSERDKPADSNDLSRAWAPYFDLCIEKFGPNRCMFESNFPVDKRSYSYNIVWNAFKRITMDFSKGERQALFFDTAVKAYRL
jgi:L-fuconolactonase